RRMTHTVESFIDTLRADGVEAGRKAAEEIIEEARRNAQQLVRDAEAKARRIVERAEQERLSALDRTRTDLELAARDTVEKLHDVLGRAMTQVLTKAVSAKLDEADFLKELIHDVVCQYAAADAVGDGTMEITVAEPMRHRLADWTIKTFHKPGERGRFTLELHAALSMVGFEYKVSDGTVEVTPESVVQVLSGMVTPELQALIASTRGGEATG
ncbi:MAG TPA: hypothetical protein DD670_05425, partial [Planctomycetaceae bacterium]|nr:hypothetical protein [Planctomycetaceae bacterium]